IRSVRKPGTALFICMIRLLAILLFLSGDGGVLKDLLDAAASGPADGLRPRLETLAGKLQDPDLRKRTIESLDSIVAASEGRRKAADLAREAVELGGKATFEPGGPAWMRELAGGDAMGVFDRLVGVSLSG